MAINKEYLTEARKLLVLGVPLIGSQVLQMATLTTDTVMLGWYSVTALAAVTLATQIYFLLMIVGMGFAFALVPLVTEALGNNDQTQLRRVTRMCLWLVTFVAVFLMVPLWVSKPIFLAMGQEEIVATEAQKYLRLAGFGIWPMMVVMVLRSYLSALEHAQIILWITAVAALLNVVVNYLFIFGYYGMPEMGIRGAALASASVAVFSMIASFVYALSHFPEHALLQRFWRPDWPAIKRVVTLGIPIIITTWAEAGLFSISAVMMGILGRLELAAHGVALQLAALTFMFHYGLAQAAAIRAGKAEALHDIPALRRSAGVALVISILFSAMVISSFLLAPEFLIQLFLDAEDPEVPVILQIGVGLLFMAAIFQLFDGTQVMALSILRGMQDTAWPMMIAAVSYWVIGAPMGYAAGIWLGYGGVGVWFGLVVGLATAAVLLNYRFWRVKTLR